MQMPSDVLAQLDEALKPQPTTRRNSAPKRERTMQTPELNDARAKLIDADEALANVESDSVKLDEQIAAERDRIETDRLTLEANHKAMREQGLDFALQLRVRRDTEDMAERAATVERAIYQQRAAMDQRLAEARKVVTAAEAVVALELLAQRETDYMIKAEAAARAYWAAKRAAWTVYQKLGRTHAPEALRTGLFHTSLPKRLPFFTVEGSSSEGFGQWTAHTVFDVTDTTGVADELRG